MCVLCQTSKTDYLSLTFDYNNICGDYERSIGGDLLILKVRYEDSISWLLPLECWVPQGSILGLVLFTMLMIDLTNEIYNSQIKMFVDACQLLF